MKKRIIALAAAILAVGAVTVNATDAGTGNVVIQDVKLNLIGDANGVGGVNLLDYRAVLQHVLKKTPITDPYLLQCADADRSGSVNLLDYRAILRHVLKQADLWEQNLIN